MSSLRLTISSGGNMVKHGWPFAHLQLHLKDEENIYEVEHAINDDFSNFLQERGEEPNQKLKILLNSFDIQIKDLITPTITSHIDNVT